MFAGSRCQWRRRPIVIGTRLPYPGFVEPSLATAIERVPSGERWIHEIKFDGYRIQVHLREGRVSVYTHRGHDWTKHFRKIAGDASDTRAGSAIIDGEVVRSAGLPDELKRCGLISGE